MHEARPLSYKAQDMLVHTSTRRWHNNHPLRCNFNVSFVPSYRRVGWGRQKEHAKAVHGTASERVTAGRGTFLRPTIQRFHRQARLYSGVRQ